MLRFAIVSTLAMIAVSAQAAELQCYIKTGSDKGAAQSAPIVANEFSSFGKLELPYTLGGRTLIASVDVAAMKGSNPIMSAKIRDKASAFEVSGQAFGHLASLTFSSLDGVQTVLFCRIVSGKPERR